MPPSLEDLKSIYNELNEINDKQERRVKYFETTSIKLVIAYIFFQAMIFMSITQKPNISCKQWWIPYGLSSLVGVIFAMTFNRFIGKWERTQYHLDMSFMERESIYHRMTLLKESQESSTYDQLMKQHPEDEILKCDIVKVYQRKAFVWIVSSALFAYTALIVTASQSVLCHLDSMSSARKHYSSFHSKFKNTTVCLCYYFFCIALFLGYNLILLRPNLNLWKAYDGVLLTPKLKSTKRKRMEPIILVRLKLLSKSYDKEAAEELLWRNSDGVLVDRRCVLIKEQYGSSM